MNVAQDPYLMAHKLWAINVKWKVYRILNTDLVESDEIFVSVKTGCRNRWIFLGRFDRQ